MAFVSPQQLAQTLVVRADSLLQGAVDLRAYPHRHLALVASSGFMRSAVPQLMQAVEHLSNYGWELVTVTAVGDGHNVYAFMRRTT
ncbi:hypothetical protein [Micromonospora halophytica]|uniref:Uncharacterized protein n=1 Tax=Micromonospora halophytica TaxID=47864 RepID=A0A1C5HR93_9ACTN|nr:hypothetical protein [Micromonospora halophytica]SCG48529.1 hypothetical protein GA0070560_105272 [Micromonospora halophytica]